MGFVIGFVIAIILVAIILVAGYAMRLFRIEKQEIEAGESDYPIWEEQLEPNVDDPFAPVPDQPEMVDLFTYFNEDEEAAEEEDEDHKGKKQNKDSGEEHAYAGEEEESAADYDRLSNLKSGRGYILDCQRRLSEAKENGVLYGAVWLDIDRFRFINNLKGYSIGDYILSRLGQEIQFIFPESTLFSRVSADHFTAVFPLMGDGILEEYSDGLRRLCEKIRVDVGLKSSIRLCIGMAMTSNAQTDYNVNVLLQKANLARHCIKSSRTESSQLYDENIPLTYLYGESAMEYYSENQYGDEFTLYYQPIADVRRNRVISSDVLVRWVCTEDSSKEIPLTPENGRLPSNGLKVIYHACRAMSRWRKAGKEVLPVYIPLLAVDLYKEDIDSFFIKCLAEFQLEPQVLYLVIDPAVVQINEQIALQQMHKLRAVGIRMGLSDIDAGYTSLGFIQEYPIDFIKINRSVLQHLESDDKSESAAEIICSLREQAGAYHITAIYEGVDSQDQVDILHKLGVCVVQGRYCGKTNEGDEFVRTLPEYLQQREAVGQTSGAGTVILDEGAFQRGDFQIF